MNGMKQSPVIMMINGETGIRNVSPIHELTLLFLFVRPFFTGDTVLKGPDTEVILVRELKQESTQQYTY